ncbi:hypothetical protein [Pseudomonas lini]|uniref:hypothetical protein n=1 Tax=Pseudomonas lini TaxID=163011 RepID=UPI0012E1775F|nr:hypothetical protein [Pseudomonas lini]
MKLDRITGNRDNYCGHLQAFCTNPACQSGAFGFTVSEQPQGAEKLPDNIHMYECLTCQHRFEVEETSSLPAEIAPVVSQRTTSITTSCPWCGERNEHKADGWPLVNVDGFFKTSPTTAFGVDCRECHAVYVLRPQAE